MLKCPVPCFAFACAGAIFLCAPAVSSAQSYSFTYTNGSNSHGYGLLNGSYLALYTNDRGDLGAPYRFPNSIEKPGGQTNGVHPIVNADGSVPETSGTYAALYSPTSTAGAGSLQASIQAKLEYATVGGSALEGYGVYVPGQNVWLHNRDFAMNSGPSAFTVNGNIGNTLTANSQVHNSANGIAVNQTITIDDSPSDGKQNVATISVRVMNNSGGVLNGIQYARVINPNMGSYTNAGTTATVQSFGTPNDPTAFAIQAAAGGHQLALGLTAGNVNNPGATLFSTQSVPEDSLFDSLDTLSAASNRLVLGSGTTASYYVGSAQTPALTGDYTTSAFANSVMFDSNSIDDTLVLLSPSYDLANGQYFDFTFNYYFDTPITAGNPVPEPGVVGLLAGGAVCATWVLRRRKMRA